ncbi:MAG: ATP-binding protein [Planctomycetia bacterium]|nr:ATP-binding protein [Planctomycetia bacterium]
MDSHESSQNELDALRKENAFLKEQLRQAATMISLGELVSTTTHEFNNLLMTIINYAGMGLRNPDPQRRDNAFEKILSAGNRAAKITASILGMARNRSPKPELSDLVRLTEDALLLLEREMNKYRVRVVVDFEKDVPKVVVNGSQIQEVLLNLLTNARQALPHGGDLIIKIKKENRTNTVDLSVRDFGTGIPQETLQHIFDPFFSTKDGPDQSGKGGTGLGLARCKTIVEEHHGRILVNSTVGKGTLFTIKLPIPREESQTT